ncbi:cell agglutination protein Mam3 [Sporothrix stenoceras]|uniref:Cell agglutination protein Mam3 n=1 Tax=Sporothrix stenoceras TaxID=5173 RepID=A0ABR3YM92_9PEZI
MASSLHHHQLGHNARPSPGHAFNGFGTARTLVLGLSRIIFASLPAVAVSAAPLSAFDAVSKRSGGFWPSEHLDSDDPNEGGANVWVLYIASAVLVLLGGAFAGLTIALMGQDSIYLQVLSRDDTDPQQKNAKRVDDLLKRGKHWVLVTLLLSNVIVNETLPVVLDRCLGGGVAAVVGIVFGEVLPQSICVRYGLQIGGIMAKPVLALMWLMAPIAWPTAKVLDHALGEDHGTVYKKSGLKTLVTLHRSLGEVSERLNQDEVTIISAVLDLKEKPVSSVMTPMEDVFTMSEDTILDEKMMDMILSAGYSRIPIHEPFNPTNFVGMLLVKILITYDPDDKIRVSEFPLATLPETRPETSCLDIVNFFQEGKSHMVLVSQYPGEDHGALGVVTLEDVIEELIGEEIIDESDVYIDVHKAIRRLQPAPRARPTRHRSLASDFGATASTAATRVADEEEIDDEGAEPSLQQQAIPVLRALSRSNTAARALSTSPKTTTVMMRRCSAGADGRLTKSTVPVRANIDEMWQHLRHLGPSNRANNPKNTRSTTVKIKQGHSHAGHQALLEPVVIADDLGSPRIDDETDDELEAGETTLLLAPKAYNGNDTQSSSHSPAPDYGTTRGVPQELDAETNGDEVLIDVVETPIVEIAAQSHESVASRDSGKQKFPASLGLGGRSISIDVNAGKTSIPGESAVRSSSENSPDQTSVLTTTVDISTPVSRRTIVRSGSITENVIETRGIRKVVLETTSSAEDDEDAVGVMTSSFVQQRSPLSGIHSPVAPRTPASGAEDETVKNKDLEAKLLAAQSAAASASTIPPSSSSQLDGTEVDNSETATAASGSGPSKKKNRRKKRKNTK